MRGRGGDMGWGGMEERNGGRMGMDKGGEMDGGVFRGGGIWKMRGEMERGRGRRRRRDGLSGGLLPTGTTLIELRGLPSMMRSV